MCEVDGERAPDLLLTLTFDLQIIPISIDTQSLNVRILPPFIIPKSGSKTKPPLDTREITSLSWELDVESLLNGGITIDFISPLPAKARLSFIDYTVFYASSRPTPCPGTMLSCEYLTLLLRAAQTSNLEPCVDELMPTVICNHQLFGQSIWTTLSPNGSTLHENTTDLEEVIKDLCLVEDFYTNPFLVIPSPGTEEIPQEWKDVQRDFASTRPTKFRVSFALPFELLNQCYKPPYTGREALASKKRKNSDDSWDDVCHICFGDGELMCCIGCPRVAHGACVSSSSTTNDGEVANWDYMCADCQGELKKNERKKGDKNENKCHICAEGGTLLCCDSCERAECTFCVRRDLEDIGKGER
ncbi:hypothetical protein TrCOL_g12533 [Triparma columacea]|uniref:Uncharacterized protein n=1 Tax=Triparma columacea TaxID=722753 RepID=A0A9W7G3N3_9STRA|nr:hypothetical protein TrCOL_g12533 [Triparma columacea]